MLITKAFLESMAQKRAETLAEKLSLDLEGLYPKRMRTMGKSNRASFALSCAQESRTWGCSNYGELKAYSFVALQLGTGFATDPFYGYIAQILASSTPFSLKMEKILGYTMDTFYIDDEAELIAYQEALDRLLKVDLEKVKSFTTYTEIVHVLKEVYPQRVTKLGGIEPVLHAIKLGTNHKPKAYNIDHPIGIFVYASLVFFLGHKVDKDPLYAWVGKYLNADELRMAHKLDRLVRVIRKRIKNNRRYIDKVLKENIS